MTNLKIVNINEINNDVKKLNDAKWQISGAAAKKILEGFEDAKTAAKKAEKMAKDAHNKVWDTIHKVTDTTKKGNYSVDTTYRDAGILFLVKKEKKSGVEGFLSALVESLED